MKEIIKNYAKEIGADDVGFASVENYKSPNTPPIKEIFPEAKTIIVLAFQQLDNCESENIQIASVGNRIIYEFAHSSTYKIARFIKREFNAKVMSVPAAGPVNRDIKTGLPFADVSLRHAAVAAGLGNFGRHNLVIHPEIGTKVIFTAIITDLNIQPDDSIKEKLCIDCDICVNQCPVNALCEEKKTDVMKCAFNSQPYGLGGNMQFWTRFAESSPEEQKKMLQDEKFGKLYQALSLGSYYVCFNCIKSCPAGS
jgi:epoxyqueuosine reductase QueG